MFLSLFDSTKSAWYSFYVPFICSAEPQPEEEEVNEETEMTSEMDESKPIRKKR